MFTKADQCEECMKPGGFAKPRWLALGVPTAILSQVLRLRGGGLLLSATPDDAASKSPADRAPRIIEPFDWLLDKVRAAACRGRGGPLPPQNQPALGARAAAGQLNELA